MTGVISLLCFLLQPGNLLLSDNGEELILMDLGSARNADIPIANRSGVIVPLELLHHLVYYTA